MRFVHIVARSLRALRLDRTLSMIMVTRHFLP